jgi:hypothetical protein
MLWSEWFGVGREGEELRRICTKVLMTQFAAEGEVDMTYPLMKEKDEAGRRKHEVLHERVVQDVVQVLEEEIDKLLEIREAEKTARVDSGGEGDLVGKVERKLNLE